MEDYQVVAAILTAALCSTKPRTTSRRLAADQWRNVWRDYNKFCGGALGIAGHIAERIRRDGETAGSF